MLELKGVGPHLATGLAAMGIKTTSDLIKAVPRKYNDFSKVQTIRSIKPGMVTLKVTISSVHGRYIRRGLHITEAIASDETGSVKLTWFNQPYRAGSIKKSEVYYVTGEFAFHKGRLGITSPVVELVSEFPINTARIVPVYRETKDVKSRQLRKLLAQSLNQEHMPETLPKWILEQEHMMDRHEALLQMHFPESELKLIEAKRRLGFEEVFSLTLASLINKQEFAQGKAHSIPFNLETIKRCSARLPFTLTDAQRAVLWSIFKDMEQEAPMNRLIEGDVGSGKTIVAALSAVMAIEAGYQVAFMAPTEILSRQHAESLSPLLETFGYPGSVGLLVGGLSSAQKKLAHSRIADGTIKLIVGTNALIQDKVVMHKLGLIIVDEQHRFGVQQRKKLQSKAHVMPHVLHMTATPIPRSLALTLYGELDVSVISQLPSGRKVITTKVVSIETIQEVYKHITQEIQAGRQAFFVCPLIAKDSDQTKFSVEEVETMLQRSPLKHFKIGILHGKLKPQEKEAIMSRFASHELDILIATTVIEVGINVPNATIMVVMGADRFGLAQIHQLRGRVGRGEHQSYCYLVPSKSEQSNSRLNILESSSDGFTLAEYDLELRGPGAIYGTAQHGVLDLRVAKLSDTKLISSARVAAQKFIDKNEDLLQYKELAERVNQLRTITNLN